MQGSRSPEYLRLHTRTAGSIDITDVPICAAGPLAMEGDMTHWQVTASIHEPYTTFHCVRQWDISQFTACKLVPMSHRSGLYRKVSSMIYLEYNVSRLTHREGSPHATSPVTHTAPDPAITDAIQAAVYRALCRLSTWGYLSRPWRVCAVRTL